MAGHEPRLVGEPGDPAPLPGRVEQDLFAAGAILAANVAVLYFAWDGKWHIAHLMMVYWVQSIIIGGYYFLRLRLMGAPDDAVTFVWLYGFFHFVYFTFLLFGVAKGDLFGHPFPAPTGAQVPWMTLACLAFLVTHYFSFRRNLQNDLQGGRSPSDLQYTGVLRAVPMHFTLLFGLVLGQGAAILIFGTLKTIVDVTMHWVEHRILGSAKSRG